MTKFWFYHFWKCQHSVQHFCTCPLMKNTINVSSNANLILNTYRCLFFQTATENLWCCSTASFDQAMQDELPRQDSMEMERFWNLQHSKFVNHNGAKIVDVWNVNKLTEARTKMECQQTYRGTDQNGSRQITDEGRAMIKSVSSNKVGANVKKTNTEFEISILNMEYVIRNMSVLISCQEPSFSDITINFWITKTPSPRS